jgi:putative cell wall-binding protein
MEEILSKSTFGLRKAGLSALAVTLTLGAGIAGAGTAYAADPMNDLTADSKPKVTQGANNQAAGDLEYVFNNKFTTNTKLTFTVDANDCSTQAGIDAAIEYAAQPDVSLAKKADTDGDARVPSYTVSLGSSGAGECAAVGIQDVVTVTLTQPSSGDEEDTFVLDLSKIAYNVGKNAALDDVDVHARGYATGDVDQNATVVNKSTTLIPLEAALPDAQAVALGDVTYTETTAGAYFKPGPNAVTLTLSAGKFTAGTKPNIQVPSGYTVTHNEVPADSSTYAFTVNAPTPPADLSKAIVTVKDLRVDAPDSPQLVELRSQVTGTEAVDLDALNVLTYDARIGGDDRYATAAALYNSEFGWGKDNYNDVAVLSGGENFPDALSANYLAGKLYTGTLLTRQSSLSPAARKAIIDNRIETVYITGGHAAVSKAVEDELKSTRVGDRAFGAYIQVVRLAGSDRYATNQKINLDSIKATDTVLMASGAGFADALALGPIAYAEQFPLILSRGTSIGSTEKSQLDNFDPSNVIIAGGTSVISQGVEDALKAQGFNVIRLEGANRTDTAAKIATWATKGVDGNDADTAVDASGIASKRNFNTGRIQVSNGLGFADALSAGPVAGSVKEVILLSRDANAVGTGLADFLSKVEIGTAAGEVNVLRALGLTAATSRSLMKAAAMEVGTAQ